MIPAPPVGGAFFWSPVPHQSAGVDDDTVFVQKLVALCVAL